VLHGVFAVLLLQKLASCGIIVEMASAPISCTESVVTVIFSDSDYLSVLKFWKKLKKVMKPNNMNELLLIVCVRKNRAVSETPSHSHGVSLTICDHTVLPATRHK